MCEHDDKDVDGTDTIHLLGLHNTILHRVSAWKINTDILEIFCNLLLLFQKSVILQYHSACLCHSLCLSLFSMFATDNSVYYEHHNTYSLHLMLNRLRKMKNTHIFSSFLKLFFLPCINLFLSVDGRSDWWEACEHTQCCCIKQRSQGSAKSVQTKGRI